MGEHTRSAQDHAGRSPGSPPMAGRRLTSEHEREGEHVASSKEMIPQDSARSAEQATSTTSDDLDDGTTEADEPGAAAAAPADHGHGVHAHEGSGIERKASSSANAVAPYSSFKQSQKWTIVVLVAFAAFFSPISSNIYFPAVPNVATTLDERWVWNSLDRLHAMPLMGSSNAMPMHDGCIADLLTTRSPSQHRTHQSVHHRLPHLPSRLSHNMGQSRGRCREKAGLPEHSGCLHRELYR